MTLAPNKLKHALSIQAAVMTSLVCNGGEILQSVYGLAMKTLLPLGIKGRKYFQDSINNLMF